MHLCTIFSYYIEPIFILDEDLIKWGWPEDVWFHVDKVSSAHVYLRLTPVSNHYILILRGNFNCITDLL